MSALCPSAYNPGRDIPTYLRSPDQLPRLFRGARLYLATIEGFGRVPVLSRSPQFLAERMGWVGLDVSGIAEFPAERATEAMKAPATTSDAIALRHLDIATREPGRPCRQCGRLSSSQTCLAASSGVIEGAPHEYRPDLTWPRRCLSYAPPRIIHDNPAPSDYDRRTGLDLWPEIAAVVELQVDAASALGKAVAMLHGLLKDGPRDAAEILAAAEGAGIGERTVQRAADQLGVVKSKTDFRGGWTWALPAAEVAA